MSWKSEWTSSYDMACLAVAMSNLSCTALRSCWSWVFSFSRSRFFSSKSATRVNSAVRIFFFCSLNCFSSAWASSRCYRSKVLVVLNPLTRFATVLAGSWSTFSSDLAMGMLSVDAKILTGNVLFGCYKVLPTHGNNLFSESLYSPRFKRHVLFPSWYCHSGSSAMPLPCDFLFSPFFIWFENFQSVIPSLPVDWICRQREIETTAASDTNTPFSFKYTWFLLCLCCKKLGGHQFPLMLLLFLWNPRTAMIRAFRMVPLVRHLFTTCCGT